MHIFISSKNNIFTYLTGFNFGSSLQDIMLNCGASRSHEMLMFQVEEMEAELQAIRCSSHTCGLFQAFSRGQNQVLLTGSRTISTCDEANRTRAV